MFEITLYSVQLLLILHIIDFCRLKNIKKKKKLETTLKIYFLTAKIKKPTI